MRQYIRRQLLQRLIQRPPIAPQVQAKMRHPRLAHRLKLANQPITPNHRAKAVTL